jgi:asparagine N-glycosylation enzyme membrane subunit Stt3
MRFDITTFTLLHVVLSLVGIIAGLVVVGGLVSGRRLDGWTGTYLATTVLTNLTGFGFPVPKFLPSHGVAVLSLIILPLAIYARYGKHLEGGWRRIFVAGTVIALYLNVFVLVNQLFRRVPALIVLAPKQQEPPFALTQILVLALFIGLGRAAWKGFAGETAPAVAR